MTLGRERLFGASESGQKKQYGHLRRSRLRRQVHGEPHRSARFMRGVFIELLHAAVAAMLRQQLNCAHEQAILPYRSRRIIPVQQKRIDMNIEFSANEARVIGCLIEKEITTPEIGRASCRERV